MWLISTPQRAKTPEPILTELDMDNYIWNPTPPHFGGVAQRGWPEQICDSSHLCVSFLFFSDSNDQHWSSEWIRDC